MGCTGKCKFILEVFLCPMGKMRCEESVEYEFTSYIPELLLCQAGKSLLRGSVDSMRVCLRDVAHSRWTCAGFRGCTISPNQYLRGFYRASIPSAFIGNLNIPSSLFLILPHNFFPLPLSLPIVMYGCESWTIKKAEHWRTGAFKL